MDRVLEMITEKETEEVVLKAERMYRRILASDIVFAETEGNYQRIFMNNGEEIRVRMTSAEVYDLLGKWDKFYKCGRAYIVNLGKISKLTNKTAVMKGGSELSIPRNVMFGLKEAYFSFALKDKIGKGQSHLKGLKLHLESLAQDYSDYISCKTETV
jgi:DNA-binding LytR/AlgR family response regulator